MGGAGASAGVPGSASPATLPADRPLSEPRVLTGGLGGDGLRAALGLGRGDRAGSPRGHAPPTGSRGCRARAGPEAAEDGEEASPERCPAAGRSQRPAATQAVPRVIPGSSVSSQDRSPPMPRVQAQPASQPPTRCSFTPRALGAAGSSLTDVSLLTGRLRTAARTGCWEQGRRCRRERAQQRLEVPPPPSGG